MFNPFSSAMSGDVSEEERKRMLGQAMLMGGVNTLGSAHLPGGQPFAQGINAMMGSIDQQQQMAMAAQMQGVQRNNIESTIENRARMADIAKQQAEQAEQRLAQGSRGLDQADQRIALTEQQQQQQMRMQQQQMQMQQGRMQEVEQFMGQLPPTDNPEEMQARQMMRMSMMYGGGMPTQAGNVLMPSGRPATGGGFMDSLLAGGMGPDGQMPVEAPQQPQAPNPVAAESFDEAVSQQGDIDVAKKAAASAQQRSLEANRFVDTTLVPASMGAMGMGFGGVTDKEEIRSLISQAEELWPSMGERERALTLEHIRRLKKRLQ